MKSFLAELAEEVSGRWPDALTEVNLVFPNRRAGLFFQKELSKTLKQATWSPHILSVDEFIGSKCPWKKLDKLALVFELYETYCAINPTEETFDQFFFWGEMLLKDFDDLDRNLVDAKHLFLVLMRQKEMDISFDVLTEEQKEILSNFWKHFADKKSRHQEEFLAIWTVLYHIYSAFRERLIAKGWAYEGMIHRYVAEHIEEHTAEGKWLFVGFNAFTKAEEKIFAHWVLNFQAEFKWDADEYYVADANQEAGTYFRQYRGHSVFSRTFPERFPQYFTQKKSMEWVGVPQLVGQAKLLGQKLTQLKKDNPNLQEEEVLVVLPDESLLFPVMHALPESFQKFNITMGYPLKSTPLYSLLESVVEIQPQMKGKPEAWTVHYKALVHLLRHPYIQMAYPLEAKALIEYIVGQNKIRLGQKEITAHFPQLLHLVYWLPEGQSLFGYLLEVIKTLHGWLFTPEQESLDQEYFYQFYTHISRLKETLESRQIQMEPSMFLKLFAQVVQSIRIPFSGEPLNGMQIMGVLETRNLDFRYVFILGMNEGSFPAASAGHSFVPYNIRKAFDLPVFDQQDAIYAYLFYRLLQRAEHVCFFSATEETGGMKAEPSRFLAQLQYESPLPINRYFLDQAMHMPSSQAIIIEKNDLVKQRLKRYLTQGGQLVERSLTPSALNNYLDCRLRFYYKYIADLQEEEEVEEEVDIRVFGLLLHDSLEHLYKKLALHKGSPKVEAKDFDYLRNMAPKCIEEAFSHHFGKDRNQQFVMEGRNVLISAIIKKFVFRVLEMDEAYAPFEIVGLETKSVSFLNHWPIHTFEGKQEVQLKGSFDRIDKKDGLIRIIDYKTGSDKKDFHTIESLFDREDKNRCKSAMQAFFYTFLYVQKERPVETVVPALINAKELFNEDFAWHFVQKDTGRGANEYPVKDSRPFLTSYEDALSKILEEIFDGQIPFDQTVDEAKCKHCAYRNLCRRG
ncbi:PD-(D/E)XK nuclease family protein [Cytophagales bacterium LB-30]|uniref:PD-(D/E)XK nuclease family protein n=1 Tax=Shiella aurantiaca TaxID=3058365 RepID=A0ABT8F7S5_9BACT|nr:PD-(D/E)XK nuclease family protein [Shiella aurantiaca]MDN4166543.1 PD-(D/E)XK nuclease family protein [Shiella aurantiaca]